MAGSGEKREHGGCLTEKKEKMRRREKEEGIICFYKIATALWVKYQNCP